MPWCKKDDNDNLKTFGDRQNLNTASVLIC